MKLLRYIRLTICALLAFTVLSAALPADGAPRRKSARTTAVKRHKAKKKKSRRRRAKRPVLRWPLVTETNRDSILFPGYDKADVGVIIRDLRTNADMVVQNPDKMLTPASITKCATAAAAVLSGLETSRFTTLAKLQGVLSPDSVFVGSLIVQGSGDPSTESHSFAEYAGLPDSIASKVNRLGIKYFYGSIEIDTLSLKEQGPLSGWADEDLPWTYGAGLYTLNFHDNCRYADRADHNPGATLRDAVRNKMMAGGVSFDTDSLMEMGIAVATADGVKVFDKELIYTHQSAPIGDLMRKMMTESNNLYAEAMLRRLTPGRYRSDALKFEKILFGRHGINISDFSVYDGSGLTRANLFSPRFMADLLSEMSRDPKAEVYAGLFPKVGMEGTVKRLLKDTELEGQLILKSGSMRGVRCYAGYKLDGQGRPTHAVVIMINGFSCPQSALTKAIGEFLIRQFGQHPEAASITEEEETTETVITDDSNEDSESETPDDEESEEEESQN